MDPIFTNVLAAVGSQEILLLLLARDTVVAGFPVVSSISIVASNPPVVGVHNIPVVSGAPVDPVLPMFFLLLTQRRSCCCACCWLP